MNEELMNDLKDLLKKHDASLNVYGELDIVNNGRTVEVTKGRIGRNGALIRVNFDYIKQTVQTVEELS